MHQQHYRRVLVQPSAMLKMIEHAQAGGDTEVMGILFGSVADLVFHVVDSVALPVDGTETRVTADALAEDWLVKYTIQEENNQSRIHALGWYHTHPGYRCWLSNIDLNTHQRYQQAMDPWLAIVIDPTNKENIEIGAFRLAEKTFPPYFSSFNVDNAKAQSASFPYYSIPIEVCNNCLVAPDKYKLTLDLSDIIRSDLSDEAFTEFVLGETSCRLEL